MMDSTSRSYAYNTLYTAAEIAQGGNIFDLSSRSGDDEEYLIVDGNDGTEYWFRRLYDLWYVGHTWGSFILRRKP